jgi:hypothetical protein
MNRKCWISLVCLVLVMTYKWTGAQELSYDKRIQLLTKAAYDQMLNDLTFQEFRDSDDSNVRKKLIETSRRSFSVETYFGDLLGNAEEEGVVVSYYNLNDLGAGGRQSILVYKFKNGEAVKIGRIECGDRAHGGIRDVRVESREIVVDRYTPDTHGCMICYGGVLREWYRVHLDHLQLWRAKYVGDLVEAKGTHGKTTWKVVPIP